MTYTPTTDQVRDGYSIDPEGEYRDPINASANQRWAERAFDRWLAAHDAETRAERVAPDREMTEHNALIWADGVTAMARGSELRMNASDVKRGNPYHGDGPSTTNDPPVPGSTTELRDLITRAIEAPDTDLDRNRWLSRVGLVRLTATEAVGNARSLLRSINRSTYRNEPEIAELLDVAREALTELYQAQVDADWQRFNGTKAAGS